MVCRPLGGPAVAAGLRRPDFPGGEGLPWSLGVGSDPAPTPVLAWRRSCPSCPAFSGVKTRSLQRRVTEGDTSLFLLVLGGAPVTRFPEPTPVVFFQGDPGPATPRLWKVVGAPCARGPAPAPAAPPLHRQPLPCACHTPAPPGLGPLQTGSLSLPFSPSPSISPPSPRSDPQTPEPPTPAARPPLVPMAVSVSLRFRWAAAPAALSGGCRPLVRASVCVGGEGGQGSTFQSPSGDTRVHCVCSPWGTLALLRPGSSVNCTCPPVRGWAQPGGPAPAC